MSPLEQIRAAVITMRHEHQQHGCAYCIRGMTHEPVMWAEIALELAEVQVEYINDLEGEQAGEECGWPECLACKMKRVLASVAEKVKR